MQTEDAANAVVREIKAPQVPMPALRLVAAMDPKEGAIIGLVVRGTISDNNIEWVSKVAYQDIGVLLSELQECTQFITRGTIETAFHNGKRVGLAEAAEAAKPEKVEGEAGSEDDAEVDLSKDAGDEAIHG